jgi:hypothetical protein
MMFGREMRSKLPELQRKQQVTDEALRDRDWQSKLNGKKYVDERRQARDASLEVGDKVLVKGPKLDKMSPKFCPDPAEITRKGRGEVTVKDAGGNEYRRHTTFVKRYNEPEQGNKDQETGDKQNRAEVEVAESPVKSPSVARDRPVRASRMPSRFEDFVV